MSAHFTPFALAAIANPSPARARRAVARAAFAVLCAGAVNAHASLINGDFEIVTGGPVITVGVVLAPNVPGWQTTAPDNKIEIWGTGYLGVPSYSGKQHAELNANFVSTLFQDVTGIGAGNIVGYQFAHRGRLGPDSMRFSVTDLGPDSIYGTTDDTLLFSGTYTDGSAAWGFYSGGGITAVGNTVRFAFESVSATGGNQAIGNFLDAADFGVGVVPEPSTWALMGLGALVIGWRQRAR